MSDVGKPPHAISILILDISVHRLMKAQGVGVFPLGSPPPAAAVSLAPDQTSPLGSFYFLPFWGLQTVHPVSGCLACFTTRKQRLTGLQTPLYVPWRRDTYFIFQSPSFLSLSRMALAVALFCQPDCDF